MSSSAYKSLTTSSTPPAMVVLFAFASGLVADRCFEVDWILSLAIAWISIFVWFTVSQVSSKHPQILGHLQLVCVLVACFFAGSYWHHGCWNWFSENDLMVYVGDGFVPVCLQATIQGEGKYSANTPHQNFDARPAKPRTTFIIRPTAIRDGDKWQAISGRAKLVIHTVDKELSFGDQVQIYGKLVAIRGPTSPGQFNFKNFYRSRGIGAVVHAYQEQSITIVQTGVAPFSGLLSRLRRQLNDLIWKHVGDEQAAFASAILLGNREQLSHDKRQKFVVTGTAHLLAISGLHIGILASMFLMFYRIGLLRRSVALWSTVIFVLFYAWLVEFRPPVTRAALLLTLFCFGRLWGRQGNELNLLAIAGLIILIANPGDLFLLGPQLSFLAVASLIMFKQQIFPPLSQDPIDILIRGTRPWWVRVFSQFAQRGKQAVAVSGLIWLLSLPLIAANYHVVTPISLLANPVVMIPIAIALFCGLAVLCCGFISSSLADLFGAGAAKSLGVVQAVIERAEAFEPGHWWTAGPMLMAVMIFYLVFVLLFWVPVQKRVPCFVVACLLWTSLLWILPLQLSNTIPRDNTQSTFIDVGHGSAAWIRSPDGRNILFDAGSMSSARFAAETISNVLWHGQIEHLDAIIISHADVDHFNALPDLVERFSVGVVYLSAPMAESRHAIVADLVRRLSESKVQVERLSSGFVAEFGERQKIEVLLPPKDGTGGNDNSNSIVLCYRAGERTLLLPGDLEGQGLHRLLQMPILDCDLVALPHHGSRNSQPDDFVRWCLPENVVISASQQKTDRGVIEQVGRQVNCVVSTGQVGTVQALVTDKGIKLRHWAEDRWLELD